MSPATAETTGTNTPCHVLAVPYPGRGHINPMMNLCKLLVASKPDLRITIVVTEEWLGLLGSIEKPAAVRFATIPNVLPSEANRGADMIGFVTATQKEMEEPFERLMDRLGEPADLIIGDTYLHWTVDVGNRRKIPVASLWTMPASVLSIFYHSNLLDRNGDRPSGSESESLEKRVDYFPGIPSIRLADLPSIFHMKDKTLLHLAFKVFPNVKKAQYLLLTGIYDLEPQVLKALSREFPFPIYTFGPTIPYSAAAVAVTAASFSPTQTTTDQPQYLHWLISQPPNSVLYISLGSYLPIPPAQMDEIADGIRLSGVRFLWAARGEAARLQERCGDAGMVVPWVEQLKVLCEPAVGGFWSHCGWNSTMEAVFAGVPVIAFPLIMDQMTIRKHVVEDWKTGVDAWGGGGGGGGGGELLRSGEIVALVKKFMDPESEEKKGMMRRARELRKATVEAVSDGGSSRANLTAFINDLDNCHSHRS